MNEQEQAQLLDEYTAALATAPDAAAPPELAPELATLARRFQQEANSVVPSASFAAQLEQQFAATPTRPPLPQRRLSDRPQPQPRRTAPPRWAAAMMVLLLVGGGLLLTSLLASRARTISGVAVAIASPQSTAEDTISGLVPKASDLSSFEEIYKAAREFYQSGHIKSFAYRLEGRVEGEIRSYSRPFNPTEAAQATPTTPTAWTEMHPVSKTIVVRSFYQQPKRRWSETVLTEFAQQPGRMTGTLILSSSRRDVSASDGATKWRQSSSENNVVITEGSYFGSEAEELDTAMSYLVQTPSSFCFKPKLVGSDVVLGRPVYVIDYGERQCDERKAEPADLRVKAWIDKSTFFTLKQEGYYQGKLIQSVQVTEMQINVPLEASLFAVPANATVYAYAIPTAVPPTATPASLAEVRQKSAYPIFVPAYVPAGLKAEPLRVTRQEANELEVEARYYGTNGWTVLTVRSGKGGAGWQQRSIYVNGRDTIKLPNGQAAYYNDSNYFCMSGLQTLVWEQEGALVQISAMPDQQGEWLFSKEELLKIAASISSSAEYGPVSYPSVALPPPISTSVACPTQLPVPKPTGDSLADPQTTAAPLQQKGRPSTRTAAPVTLTPTLSLWERELF